MVSRRQVAAKAGLCRGVCHRHEMSAHFSRQRTYKIPFVRALR